MKRQSLTDSTIVVPKGGIEPTRIFSFVISARRLQATSKISRMRKGCSRTSGAQQRSTTPGAERASKSPQLNVILRRTVRTNGSLLRVEIDQPASYQFCNRPRDRGFVRRVYIGSYRNISFARGACNAITTSAVNNPPPHTLELPTKAGRKNHVLGVCRKALPKLLFRSEGRGRIACVVIRLLKTT